MTAMIGFGIGAVGGFISGCIFMALFFRRNADKQAEVNRQLDSAAAKIIGGEK